jgi:thymidylate synthase (FAD)
MADSPDDTVQRVSVPTLDAILGQRFPVLNDGFVRVVDYMGSDASIVQAARVSYGAGTKRAQEDDALIRYLLRHAHTTPFEMCELKLHVRVPMDCWRQWIRHRTASVNEYSTRYSVAIDAAQRTDPAQWRTQATANRQGSGDFLSVDIGASLTVAEDEFLKTARDLYEQRLAQGVAREQARKDLPLSTYTEAYWKVDLHNLFHFLHLRMDKHAQHEIRQYATIIGREIVSRWCPVAWNAFLDYRHTSITLSALQIRVVRALTAGGETAALAEASALGLTISKDGAMRAGREMVELRERLVTLGLPFSWIDTLSTEK